MKKRAQLALALLFFAMLVAGCFQAEGIPALVSVETNHTLSSDTGVPSAGHAAVPYFTPRPYPLPSPTPSSAPAPSPALSPAPSPNPSPAEEPATGGHVTFSDLAPTTRMSFEELVGDNGNYEAVKGYPAPGTFRLVVDLYHQVVIAYKKDKNGAYTVPVRYMVCSSGSSKHPSPRGTYETGKHRVRFGLFVNDGVYGQYWSQITRRIYFHSLLYSSKNAKTYTTTSYKNLGSRASHGCIRLLVPDARWIYYHIAPGTEVELRKGDKQDTQTAAIKEQLTRPSLPKQRPNLKQGEIPYTDNWNIETYLSNYKDVVYIKR